MGKYVFFVAAAAAAAAVQVHDIVRTIDLDCDGFVSWDEFKRAFFKPSESHLTRALV